MAELTPKHYRAIQCLLKCPTRAEAAKEAGLSVRTIERYLGDPDFMREYRRAFESLVDDATRQVQRSLSPAVSALAEIVTDKETATPARISAARAILEYGLKFTEINDIVARIEALEEVRHQ